MLLRALSVHIAHETAGAARIGHSLRPLIFEGEMFKQNSRETRGEIVKLCFPSLRGALATTCPPKFGERRRKQSILSLVAAWIASRSLSSGARSRDPMARNDGCAG
jgi:hypothetical protein